MFFPVFGLSQMLLFLRVKLLVISEVHLEPVCGVNESVLVRKSCSCLNPGSSCFSHFHTLCVFDRNILVIVIIICELWTAKT